MVTTPHNRQNMYGYSPSQKNPTSQHTRTAVLLPARDIFNLPLQRPRLDAADNVNQFEAAFRKGIFAPDRE